MSNSIKAGSRQTALIIEALAGLSETDQKTFLTFLQSPFFNTKPEITQVGAYLLECAGRKSVPENEQLLSFFPKKGLTTQGQQVLIAFSKLLQLFETFLSVRALQSEPVRQKTEAAHYYRQSGLDRHFRISLRKAADLMARGAVRNAAYLEQNYQLEWERYQSDVADQRTGELNIQSLSNALDTAFMANKLRLACLAISHQAIYKTHYTIDYLDAVLQQMERDSTLRAIPALGLYYHCYQFLTISEGEAHFNIFRKMLADTAGQFPESELRLLYLLAINYGIRQINRTVSGAVETTLELYQGALKYDLLIENGTISRFAFSNIVAIALRAGASDWTADFIRDYQNRLERQWRQATASLCMARLEFERGRMTEAMRYLQHADYKDTMNNISAKILQMKIYYETGEVDTLESHLKNLKNYIRRHTAIGYHRTNYGNIVHFTEQILWLNRHDRKQVALLIQEITGAQILTEKDWLLRQLQGGSVEK